MLGGIPLFTGPVTKTTMLIEPISIITTIMYFACLYLFMYIAGPLGNVYES